jgi:ABC-type uncharacterized transport system involved in gliding motility auxiliary subunit
VIDFFISRQARYGANVALSIVGVIGIAIFINAIVIQRFDKRVDITINKLYTLSEQTRKILKSVDKDIRVTAFLGQNVPAQNQQRIRDILALYQRETAFVTASYADPYIDESLTKKYNIRVEGTIVFESDTRHEKVTTIEEQKFTSAILKLIRDESKKVYFLVGHEEHEIEDFNNNGYSGIRAELENQNYAAFSLSLLTEPDIPTDCKVLVIAGPKATLTRHELDVVTKYLERNGKLLLMLDPSLTSAADVNIELVRLMKKWGIKIGNDLVIDQTEFVPLFGPSAPVPGFELHEITRSMRDFVAFLRTRSVTPTLDGVANLSVKSIAKTIGGVQNSWGETERAPDGTFSRELIYTPGVDTPPPVSVVVAVEQKADNNTQEKTTGSPTRIVVFGDSDFAANAALRVGNRDLFLATINWLTLEEDLIAIRPIDLQKQALRQMRVQDIRLVQITSVFLIPLIVFIAGLIVWWQRRKGERA